MAETFRIGHSKRGNETAIINGYEFWKLKQSTKGETSWRCAKYDSLKCRAKLRTAAERVLHHSEHNHEGNVANAFARQAVHEMKQTMHENMATPAAARGAVSRDLPGETLMALPDKSLLARTLRRYRSKALNTGADVLPPLPLNMAFQIPERFTQMIMYDSFTGEGDGHDRIIIIGDPTVIQGLERSSLWIADGTFKKVPNLFFQLYTIHYELGEGINPAGLYCLLPNKTQETYQRLFTEVGHLLPNAHPDIILTDFEMAAMTSFRNQFPAARLTGCYFHLAQSVIRKVGEIGMRPSYDSDDDIRGMVRCLPALAHVPVDEVVTCFQTLAAAMPTHENMDELLDYFERTYVQGRRLPGRGQNFRPALFPPETWNQMESATAGVARTTNIAEGWHHGLQSLFLCDHPSLWVFFDGLLKDIANQKACYLQGVAGGRHQVKKIYTHLKERVQRAVARYNQTDTITYLRAIAYLSHT